jgi:hypothetical protein
MSVFAGRNQSGTTWEPVGNQLHPHPSQPPKGAGVGVAETDRSKFAASEAERVPAGATAGDRS